MEDTSWVNLTLDKYNELYDKSKEQIKINTSNVIGWRPISEYNKDKYDWVLIKYFDGDYECVPCVAEMRADRKWYDRSDNEVPFEVRYFFDIQQLDKI